MEFTVLTYNIHKAIGTDGLYQPDRIIQILKDSRADIIALQEVDHLVPRSNNDELAKKIAEGLGMHFDLGLNVKLKKGAYGNATISRFPIIHSENLNLTWSIKKPRGCLLSRIRIGDQEIGFMNYHLGLAGMERTRQVRMILESSFLEVMRDKPVVILGDSNDRAHKLNRMFLRTGFRDTWGDHRKYSFPSYAPIMRLDKIFVNSGLWVQEHHVVKTLLTRKGSDHLPVLAKVKIVEKPTSTKSSISFQLRTPLTIPEKRNPTI